MEISCTGAAGVASLQVRRGALVALIVAAMAAVVAMAALSLPALASADPIRSMPETVRGSASVRAVAAGDRILVAPDRPRGSGIAEAESAGGAGRTDTPTRPLAIRFVGALQDAGDSAAAAERAFTGHGRDAHEGNVTSKSLARDVYPGIEVDLYPAQGGVEYDLIVHPGADPRAIAIAFDGALARHLDDNGDAWLMTATHAFRHAAPVAYQDGPGGRKRVSAHYAIDDDEHLRIVVGDYDHRRDLVIDPFITASRYLGGIGGGLIEDAVLGPDGRLYVYGTIGTNSFEGVDSAAVTNAGRGHVFVARLNGSTLAVEYVAVVGRHSASFPDPTFEDRVEGLAVGPDGSAYVAAYASPLSFPVTGGIYDEALGARFIYRVDGAGRVAPFAGPLDPAIQTIRALAVDAQGGVHFTGRASSALVTTPGAALSGAVASGPFVTRLHPSGAFAVATTFLTVPGSRAAMPDPQSCRKPLVDHRSTGHAIALGADGAIYVAGQAAPNDFPVTPGALDTSDASFRDAFVAKVDPTGTAIRFVARIGGDDNDRATAIVVAPDGNVVVAGKSLQGGMHGTSGAFQTAVGYTSSWSNACEGLIPAEEGFLVKLAPTGDRVLFAAMVGATGGNLDRNSPSGTDPMPLRVTADAAGNLYVAGATESNRTLPSFDPMVADGTLGTRPKPFVMKVLPSGDRLAWSSAFGERLGPGWATGLGVDARGNVMVAGYTGYEEFPVVNTAPFGRRTRAAGGFVTKIADAPAPLVLTASPSPSQVGGAVRLTARLAEAGYAGAIEFRDGGSIIATVPLLDGTGQASVALSTGVHRLSAVVRGTGLWDGHATPAVYHAVQQPSAMP